MIPAHEHANGAGDVVAGRGRRNQAILALRLEVALFLAFVLAAALLTRSVPETVFIVGGLGIMVIAVGVMAGLAVVAARGVRAIRGERVLGKHRGN